MKPNSLDHEATFCVCNTTCLKVHTEYIVHVETGAAASVESETKLLHICHVLLCEVARLEVQDFTPYLKAEGFNVKAVFATGLILLSEAAAWENDVHAFGNPFLPRLRAVEAGDYKGLSTGSG